MHAHRENGARAPGFEAGRGKTGNQKADVRARTGLPERVPQYGESRPRFIFTPASSREVLVANHCVPPRQWLVALRGGALL